MLSFWDLSVAGVGDVVTGTVSIIVKSTSNCALKFSGVFATTAVLFGKLCNSLGEIIFLGEGLGGRPIVKLLTGFNWHALGR